MMATKICTHIYIHSCHYQSGSAFNAILNKTKKFDSFKRSPNFTLPKSEWVLKATANEIQIFHAIYFINIAHCSHRKTADWNNTVLYIFGHRSCFLHSLMIFSKWKNRKILRLLIINVIKMNNQKHNEMLKALVDLQIKLKATGKYRESKLPPLNEN